MGKKLSKRLGYFFIDTDREIEKEQGCTISEIFKYGGEICFRDLETNMLQQLQAKQNLVIATGGGMVMRQENRNLMQNLGTRVYLKVGLEELIRRLKKDKKRPLLQEARPIQRITEMLEQEKVFTRKPNVLWIQPIFRLNKWSPKSFVSYERNRKGKSGKYLRGSLAKTGTCRGET